MRSSRGPLARDCSGMLRRKKRTRSHREASLGCSLCFRGETVNQRCHDLRVYQKDSQLTCLTLKNGAIDALPMKTQYSNPHLYTLKSRCTAPRLYVVQYRKNNGAPRLELQHIRLIFGHLLSVCLQKRDALYFLAFCLKTALNLGLKYLWTVCLMGTWPDPNILMAIPALGAS